MGMVCTEDGWDVKDKPSCKRRCSGESGRVEFVISQEHKPKIGVKVENLRHSQNINVDFTGKQMHTSTRAFTGVLAFNISCNDSSLTYTKTKYIIDSCFLKF